MSDKKRSRRRKDEYTGPGGVQEESDKPSKEEYAVAKWLKNNVRTKRTKFLSHNVEYFTATKALDALMNSKFSNGDNCLFPTREHAIEFLDLMLEHRFFHRAKKVPVFLEDLKSGGGSGSCGSSCGVSSSGGKSKNQQKESSSSSAAAASTAATTTVSTTSNTSGSSNVSGTSSATTLQQTTVTKRDTQHKDEKDKDKSDNLECCGGQVSAEGCGGSGGVQGEEQTKEKRKRKIKLDMHPEQVFVDGSEAYVWIYDPVPIHYWIYGLALVLGAILLCLFPLWPPILRKGVYYLSVAAAGFLVFILVLTIVRLIIFVIVWILSGGKLYLWIFPNLTEDVGFLASFWPLYESEYYVESGGSSKSNKKSKKKKKDKDSDAEDEVNVNGGKSGNGNQQKRPLLLETEKIENIKENESGSIPSLSPLLQPSPSDLITGNGISNDDNVNVVDQNYDDNDNDDGDDDDYDDNYKGDDDDESEENCINTIQNTDRDNDDSLNVDDNNKKKKISKINLTNIKNNDDKVTGKSSVTTTTTTPSADKKENTTPSESESEGSRSSTGKDFEILDATEVADDPDAET